MEILAFRLAFLGNSLIIIFIAAISFGITPLRLANPAWVSGFSEVILSNTFMVLCGLSFIYLAAYLDPSNNSLLSHRARLSKLCFLSVFGFVMLIPLQFYVANNTIFAMKQRELYQYETSARQVKFLAKKISESQNFDQLQSVMKEYQAFQIPDSERSKSLQSLKILLLTKTDEALTVLKNRRRPELVTASTWEAYKSAIRNSIYSVAYVLVFSAFAQRSQSNQSWLQDIMQGLLKRLYADLERRETRLSTEPIPTYDLKSSAPSSQEQLLALQRQGLLDQAWISGQEDPDVDQVPSFTELEAEAASGSDSDSPEQLRSRGSGLFSWLRSAERRRHDDTTTFLQSLVDEKDSDQASAAEHESTESNPFHLGQAHGVSDQLSAGQQRPVTPSQRRSKITDLDYFEQLAEDNATEISSQDPPPKS